MLAVDASTIGLGRDLAPAADHKPISWAERWRNRANDTTAAPPTRALRVCPVPVRGRGGDAVEPTKKKSWLFFSCFLSVCSETLFI